MRQSGPEKGKWSAQEQLCAQDGDVCGEISECEATGRNLGRAATGTGELLCKGF